MFEIALAIGIFSYTIFFLGLLHLLYPFVLIPVAIFFWGLFIFFQRNNLSNLNRNSLFSHSKFFTLGIVYLAVQAVVNFVGLFGPEIGFDATWYHLTLPKLYLLFHAVVHIPGTILYYSDMPKLTEMLYTAGLAFGSDFFARGIHFLFGIMTLIVLYKLGRKFLSPSWALLIPIIFYSNLVVGWESISAYIDLSRTFFTSTALLAFFEWVERKEQKYFYYTSIFVGMTIATKLLALPDLAVFAFAIFLAEKHVGTFISKIKHVASFLLIALFIPLPWFVFSYIHTGNPLYPMFSDDLINSLWDTFARSSDPINPIFLLGLPLLLLYSKKLWREIPFVMLFALGGLIAWYITPQTGGGRHILPYLSALSLAIVYLFQTLPSVYRKIFLLCIGITVVISVGYRGVANAKFLPVIFHKETMGHFMQNHLQFQIGDFYDIDGYFSHHIKPTDRVLLYGFHNLYYVDFPFMDSSWVAKGNTFNYIAVQGTGMPERFQYWHLVYFNPITQVRLYSFEGKTWYY